MPDARSSIQHLIVSAYPSRDSFGEAVVAAYGEVARAQGQVVVHRDLYAIGFDPVLRAADRPTDDGLPPAGVAADLSLIAAADAVILAYPIWFGLPPAILVGYIDRVLGAGCTYHAFREGRCQPRVVGKPLLTFTTSGLPLDWLDTQGQPKALRDLLDIYLRRGFGFGRAEHVMLDSVTPGMTDAQAAAMLTRVRAAAERTCRMLSGFPVDLTAVEA